LAVARPVVGYSVSYAGSGPTRSVIFEFNGVSVATTDLGASGAAGAFALTALSTLAAQTVSATSFVVDSVGGTLSLTSSGGVAAAAVVTLAIGTAAEATTGALNTGNSGSLMASTALATLAAGIATNARFAVAASTRPIVNATAGTSQLFLNLGIALDAGSTANGALVLTGRIVLNYTQLNN
jgi:hypothetical protein